MMETTCWTGWSWQQQSHMSTERYKINSLSNGSSFQTEPFGSRTLPVIEVGMGGLLCPRLPRVPVYLILSLSMVAFCCCSTGGRREQSANEGGGPRRCHRWRSEGWRQEQRWLHWLCRVCQITGISWHQSTYILCFSRTDWSHPFTFPFSLQSIKYFFIC